MAVWAALMQAASAAAQPCVACTLVILEPEQARDLPAGLEVLVAARPGAAASVRDALERITQSGSRPAVMVEVPAPEADKTLLTGRQVLDLKHELIRARASYPGIRVVIAAPETLINQLRQARVTAYADEAVDLAPRILDSVEPVTQAATTGERRVAYRLPNDPRQVLADLAAIQGSLDPVNVVALRPLTVDEIVARHQAAAARQAADVHALISIGAMTLAFEAPGFAAPVTIASRATIFAGDGRTEIEQRDVRVNGLGYAGGKVPRLPIIEPERVASPPLAITLTDVYRYELEGEDTIDEARCYVVRFEPRRGGTRQTLFQGRAWIDAATFGMVRVAAAQTGLRGPIVSSEQDDRFRMTGDGLWLLARSDVRQMYEGAAHRTPIHRVLTLETHEVNPPDFHQRLRAAHASPAIMLADTPQGFRYLQPPNDNRSTVAGGVQTEEGRRPEATRAENIRMVALGAIVDPNITRPLPFAGLSYVDFNLFGTGTQFSGFFGGTYGQLAFSVPSLGGTRWQLAGRAFGIASSYNDRAFEAGRERYEHDIRQRPAHASAWLLRPLAPRLTFRAGYEFDYTHFSAADVTSPAFVVPADQVAHTLRLALEGQRAGWTASVWWAPARRSGWRRWGLEDPTSAAPAASTEYRSGHRDFQRYGAAVARPLALSPRLAARFEAAWMSGHDLDRFSRYTFGTFDNRLRGYPSALIRYDRGAVVRAAAAWSAARWLRADGFVDSAWVHDPGFGRGLRRYTGVGAAAEIPAPFGTLAAIEWGYGFQGVNSDGTRGTQVFRVTAYKVF